MGIYKDPYHRCGAVMADLFKAVRMVVDTGMNYYRWPRQKAIDYMKQHLLQPEVEILSETLRYSTGIQGQAVAYKLGRLKILEAREKAEKALGDKFDIKAFHDAILDSGTLPLFLLQDHVDRFIRLAKRK
jgi:prolyl oligopeptidase